MSIVTPNPKSREAIGARLRYDVLRRCNFACFYCGVPAAMGVKQLHIDHVIPVALGGTNDPWNLIAACWDCNAGKSNMPPQARLVERVRSDYATYQAARGVTVVNCEHCHLPLEVPIDEDTPTRCEACDKLLFDGVDCGVLSAFRHPERAYRMFLRLEQAEERP